MVSREDIISHFRLRPRPLGFKELAQYLDLGRAEQRHLKRLLREMLHTGELVMTRKGLYAPAAEMNLSRGYYEAHGEYGFVIVDTPGKRDIFIPPGATMGAMDNDRVVARIEPPGRKGRIIRVLERAHSRIAGKVEKTRTACFVRPKSRALAFDVFIPQKECAGVRDGQRVLVELTEYPSDKRPPAGRILKVLEEPDTPLAEVEDIIEEFGLPKRFPKEVLEEARAVHLGPDPARRKDLTGLPTITIDGERARDFDDAVSIRLTDLGFRLWVHIADVSSFVAWDSALDIEARSRGTSIYFPDRVIPMLPRELSEDLCSLVPGEVRRAFTVEMDFDRYGKRFDARFYPSLIRSDRRMTYTDVARILVEGDPGLRKKYDSILAELERMAELASEIRARRFARGSLDFDLPEPDVVLDIRGRPEAIIRSERNLAHLIIEEFMVAANEAVAERLAASGMPSIYRVHEEPEPEKIQEIFRLSGTLLKKNIPSERTLFALLQAAKNTPSEEIVNYLVLRNLKQARYSSENVGHFGLASDCYTHFTSPIRRYPDLVVHRILKEAVGRKALSDRRTKELADLLTEIAFSSSRMERRADEAERAVLKAMKAWFMKDRVGEEFTGRIIGVTSYGARVRLEDFFVEGFLHVSCLTDDFYLFDEKSFMLSGRRTGRKFRVGDKINVRVDRVDMDEKEVLLGIGK